jgi:hypothetical protein
MGSPNPMPDKIDANQKDTAKHAIGKWFWEADAKDKQLEIIITKNTLTIQPGKDMVFKIKRPKQVEPMWFGEYLVFLPTLFFVRYADENVLLFGELKHRYKSVNWEKEFKRIKPFK